MATIIGSTNNSQWTYKLEVSESVPSGASTSNLSTVTVDVYIGRASSRSYIGGTWSGNVIVDGTTNSISGTIPYPTYIDGGAWHQIATTSFSVRHNDDGSKTASVSSAISSNDFTPSYCSASGNVTLYTIPRYFSSTPTMEVISRTTNSVTIKWTTPENASQSQYSVGDTSHWVDVETGINKKTGTMTISGFSPAQTKRIYGDFKRADSGLWCQTKPYVDATTLDYAKLSSAPNFNDENNPTITYTNPMGNNTTTLLACIASTDGQTIYVDYRNINKTGTLSYTFNLTTAERNALRNVTTSSNTKQVNFYIKTVVDGNTYYSYLERTLTIVNANPVFSNFTVTDGNASIVSVTGSNQYFVKGYSIPTVYISNANKMVAQKGASPKNYVMACDTLNQTVNYSSGDITKALGTIINSGTKKVTVTAYDSRTNSTSVEKNIHVYDYGKPVINASVERLNRFENQTTISISGTFSKLVINDVAKNTLKWVKYRYRETEGTWNGWTELTTTLSDGTFTCSNVVLSLDNTKSFEFEFDATDNIDTTLISKTLDIGKAIFFISSNLRECFVDGDLEVNGTVRIYKQSPFASLDNFKSFCIYNAPSGISFWALNIDGAVGAAILQKASSDYLSFIYFSYGINMIQYKYNNGTWSTYQ